MKMKIDNKELYELLRSEGYFIKYDNGRVFFGAKHTLTLNEVDLAPVEDKKELARDLLEWSGLRVVPKLKR